ncbi:MAG: hypothetical protein J5841_07170 [Clostridia bacterium]|nr:hypothetical protein [Clostridia bacterium]
MKKVLCLCIAFLLCFMTVGYAAEEATSTDAAEETADDLFGRVEDENYVNELIGFGFKLDGWHFCTDEEIDALNAISKTVLTEDFAKMMEQVDNLYIMMALANDGTNINISLRPLGDYAVLYKAMGMESIAKSSVDSTVSMLKMAGYQDVSVEYIKTPVEDQEYDGLQAKFNLQNQSLCSRIIMLICDKYLVTITMTGRDENKVGESFQKLYHLK